MEEYLYTLHAHYFKVLENLGYYPYKDMDKLLILEFIQYLSGEDFRGYLTKQDCGIIERALECLYGTSCLTPYTNKEMGTLKLGDLTEILERIEKLEAKCKELEEANAKSSANRTLLRNNA